MEKAACPEDLEIIRQLFGSRAQTLINVLLAFDSYFQWYYPLKESVPFDCDMGARERRALENTQLAIDLHEIVERLTARGHKGHKSWLFHGAIFKLSRDILRVGDIWATSSEPLELQNADTKRRAQSSGSRRIVLSGKYTTTTAISSLYNLLSTQYLRRGDGIVSMRDSRRIERVFGQNSIGRLELPKSDKSRAVLDEDLYNPKEDSCIKAFVRLLAQHALEGATVE